MNRERGKRVLAGVLSLVLSMSVWGGMRGGDFAVEASEPPNRSGVFPEAMDRNKDEVTWDCIYFGTWIPETTGTSVQAAWIKWRVIAANEDKTDVLVISDQNLAYQPYNETWENGITWDNCTLRSWLNEFVQQVFSKQEQRAMKEVCQGDKISLLTSERRDDDVYVSEKSCRFLKLYEAVGFDREFQELVRGGEDLTGYYGENAWWIRSGGSSDDLAAVVTETGELDQEMFYRRYVGVRPVLRLDLTKAVDEDGNALWCAAGRYRAERDELGSYEAEVIAPVDFYPFVPLQKGDVDENGTVSLEDVQLTLAAYLDMVSLDKRQMWCARLSGADDVTLEDVQLLLGAYLDITDLEQAVTLNGSSRQEISGEAAGVQTLHPVQPAAAVSGQALTEYGAIYQAVLEHMEQSTKALSNGTYCVIGRDRLPYATSADMEQIRACVQELTGKPLVFLRDFKEAVLYDGGVSHLATLPSLSGTYVSFVDVSVDGENAHVQVSEIYGGCNYAQKIHVDELKKTDGVWKVQ